MVFEKVLPILCLCELGGQSKAQVEAGFARRRSGTSIERNCSDGMVKAMTKHVMEKHPDVAKAMEAVHKETEAKSCRNC